MKKVVLGALTALMTLCVQSQELPTIMPPSPEAASLGKFTEVPVSHYTGVPNISIPIYTINAKGISIPINLSYHARGVMVEELASRVGIGWALSYGGSLSRQIRGQADNRSEYTTTTYADTPNSNVATGIFASQTARQVVLTREAAGNPLDLVPDLFSFNAGGTSGTFIFDRDTKKPILQEYDDVTIEHVKNTTTNNYTSFIITDKAGNKFTYGEVYRNSATVTARDYDQTITNYVVTQGQGYLANSPGPHTTNYNAWKLLRIETTLGDIIDFSYISESPEYIRRSYDKVDIDNPGNLSVSYGSKIRSYQHQLSEISFPTGKVVFVNGTSREDLTGSTTLGKVKVLDTDGTLIKELDLDYVYSENTSATNVNPEYFTLDPTAKKRLMLASVQEKKGVEVLPKTKFNYNPTALPNRFSNSQDSWGYYNGADNGHFLTFFNGGTSIRRNVNEMYSEAGMLQNIEYPTGGKVQMTFEHNVVQKPSFYNSILIAESNPRETRSHVLNKNAFTFNGTAYEKTVTVEDNSTGTTGNYKILCQSILPVGSPLPNCNFSFVLRRNFASATSMDFAGVTGSTQSLPLYGGSNKVTSYTILATPLNGIKHGSPDHDFTVELDWDIILDPAVLFGAGKRISKIEHVNEDGVISSKEFNYSLTGDSEDNISTSGLSFGIPFFYDIMATALGGVPITFRYPSGGGSPMTSLAGNSVGYSNVTEYYGEKNNNIGKTYYEFTNAPNTGDFWEFPYHIPTNLEWLRGKPLSTKIYSKEGATYTLQKEVLNEYLYGDDSGSVIGTGGLISLNFIFAPSTQLNPIATNLTGTDLFYTKNRKYHKTPLTVVYNESAMGNTFNYKYRTYHLTGGALDLKKTTTKDYYDNGVVFTTITENTFDYDKHYQLKTTKVTDSNGDVIETKNYYPADVGGITSLGYDNLTGDEYNAIHKMKAPTLNPAGLHQVATPVQVETRKNAALVSALRTNFFIDTNNSNMVLPKNVETLKGAYDATNNPLEERIVYHSYYDNGNVQEVSKTDGTHIVYIWGYDRTVPIAKIESATFTEVETAIATLNTSYNTLIEIQGLSNSDNDRTLGSTGNEGAFRTALADLRNALPNSQMTTFTYDPLVGVTSITDPRGRTIYYIYDSFNRLKYVKDHDGNVLSENEYNYKN